MKALRMSSVLGYHVDTGEERQQKAFPKNTKVREDNRKRHLIQSTPPFSGSLRLRHGTLQKQIDRGNRSGRLNDGPYENPRKRIGVTNAKV